MQDLNQLKTMIDTLQMRRVGFKKQIDEFKKLQEEIAQLHSRAATDPDAQRKLKNLDGVLKGDRVPKQMADKAAMMKKTFEQLGKQLKQLVPDQVAQPGQTTAAAVVPVVEAPVKPVMAKKHRRAFI
ncbi:hypothetical protein [Winslowiella iniecta]|uniref:Uncharacterized protein n=1 Tax=Winslowiella iniecta TaxID=1560201 RepID=A0A0L7SXS9_9GAMM|nr:hypothetical protein [Winslowiella iniecta]KOC87766.1 hypothetical protein NG42_18860 [Winslowiella iniecta]KOC90060.1 hypothetical protein NG43_17895 [Winslowiella iniecta]